MNIIVSHIIIVLVFFVLLWDEMNSLRSSIVSPRLKNSLSPALNSSPRYYSNYIIFFHQLRHHKHFTKLGPLFAKRQKSEQQANISYLHSNRGLCKILLNFLILGTDAKSDEEIEKLFNQDKPGWVSVQWGGKERTKAVEMDDRIRKALQFDSKQLSKEESERLKVSLGLDAEELALLAKEEDSTFDEKLLRKGSLDRPGERKRPTKTDTLDKKKVGKKEPIVSVQKQDDDEFSAIRIKGFLELNPYICSGCGTPFQSKNENNPGFLPKEKFVEHQNRAKHIRDKQEAVKILRMAGRLKRDLLF